MNSFENKKQLKFVITLGTGKFGSSNNNQIIISGLRASVFIDKAGGMQMGSLRASIFGVSQSDMNSITTLQWTPGMFIPNTVEVFAIDGKQENLVFAGNIVNAWGDYQNIPDVFLYINAQSAYYNQIASVKPFSIKGTVTVDTVMRRIAKDMGLDYENNNVDITLTDVYLANTLKEQAQELARQGGFDLYIDDKTLAITNRFFARKGDIPLVSSGSGLIGYPTFDAVGVTFQTFFNPAITFGGSVRLKTSIKQADGEFIVYYVAHRLESEKPNGVWQSTIRANISGLAIVKQ